MSSCDTLGIVKLRNSFEDLILQLFANEQWGKEVCEYANFSISATVMLLWNRLHIQSKKKKVNLLPLNGNKNKYPRLKWVQINKIRKNVALLTQISL